MTLCCVATFAAQDERGRLLVTDHCWVDFAQVYRHRVLTGRWLGQMAVLNHDMPHVAAGAFVVDQPHFLETQNRWKVCWQGNADLWVSQPVRQFKHAAIEFDRRILPDSCAKLLGPMWIPGLRVESLGCLRRLARPVKALLSRINRVRVQGRLNDTVAQARSGFLREPDAFLADHAPVSHQQARIDATACQSERIC